MKLPACYLFYNGDVFDLFLPLMSEEKMEIMFSERRSLAVRSPADARAHLASACVTNTFLTRSCSVSLSRGSPLSNSGREQDAIVVQLFPVVECSEGRWFHLRKFVSPLLWKRIRGGGEASGPSQKPLLFIIRS